MMLSITTHKSQTSSFIPRHIGDRSNSQKTGLNKSSGMDFNWKNIAIQPKLKINQPGDKYEQEADAMADKVMRMPEPSTSTEVSFTKNISNIQRKCAHCQEEDEIKLQRKGKTFQHTNCVIQKKCTKCTEEDTELQRKECDNSLASDINSTVQQTLQSTGQPLDNSTRSFMEQRFMYDFSKVQIHNNALASQSSKIINAHAYTHGNHIVFGAGQFQPKSESGKRLLAHELT
ncbi:MAG TPA: DUF4157 domain-containing protein, partial [Gillisia sp.]|nr:DUF4157 domain-containing protein [Gillisia sp.]